MLQTVWFPFYDILEKGKINGAQELGVGKDLTTMG